MNDKMKCPNDKGTLKTDGAIHGGIQLFKPCPECGCIWLLTDTEQLELFATKSQAIEMGAGASE